MQYFTGSKAHNVALRQRALKMGYTLNEYSLADLTTEIPVAGRTEEDSLFKTACRCDGNVAPLPREAAGRGRGWGVPRQTRCRKSKPIDPPPPTSRASFARLGPRHARGRVEGGEITAHSFAFSPRVSREFCQVRSALSKQGRRECREKAMNAGT